MIANWNKGRAQTLVCGFRELHVKPGTDRAHRNPCFFMESGYGDHAKKPQAKKEAP